MLKITDLSLRRGSRLLLENVELDVFPGQRLGLTGANGSGKSSLFAVIAGRLEPDQGNVTLPRDTLITEVLQEIPDSDRTAIDYVIDGDCRNCAHLHFLQRRDGEPGAHTLLGSGYRERIPRARSPLPHSAFGFAFDGIWER